MGYRTNNRFTCGMHTVTYYVNAKSHTQQGKTRVLAYILSSLLLLLLLLLIVITIISYINPTSAHFCLIYLFIYFSSRHVSGIHVPIIKTKQLYLCDTGICVPDTSVASIQQFSPHDGHMDARSMQLREINTLNRIVHLVGLIYETEDRHTICFALHRPCLSCSRIGEGVRKMEVILYDESMVVRKILLISERSLLHRLNLLLCQVYIADILCLFCEIITQSESCLREIHRLLSNGKKLGLNYLFGA